MALVLSRIISSEPYLIMYSKGLDYATDLRGIDRGKA